MISIYRACSYEMDKSQFNNTRPEWYDKKDCFLSFYQSWTNHLKPEDIHIVFDGSDTEELAKYIQAFKIGSFLAIDQKEKETFLSAHKGDLALLKSYEVAEKIDFDSVYFIEDDYMHTPDAIKVLDGGLKNFKNVLFTLYDHPDRYTRTDDITKGQEQVLVSQDCHWRTAESTTCTFAMTKEVFDFVKNDLRMFKMEDRDLWRYLFNRHQMRLLTPMPGKSTHVNKFFMTPFFEVEDPKTNQRN